MEKYQVILLALLFAVAMVPAAEAAATIADIYKAPSEAYRLYGPTNSTCQEGETLLACNDTQFPDSDDAYTVLGDGSTASASSETLADRGNTQTAVFKLVYDVEGLIAGGSYVLRFATPEADENFQYRVCAYLDDNTYVNTSSCIDINHTAASGGWEEGDIDAVVRESAERFDNRIVLRMNLVADGESAIEISEIYLKRPFKPADFSIVPGGVSETEIDHRVRNTWAIVSVAEIPDITNASCDLHKMPYIDESISDINMSRFNPQYEIGDGNEYFSVSWDANSSLSDMDEGFNYEVYCSGWLGDVWMDGFSQFVYVNREQTIWGNIQDIVTYLLQLIGLATDTNEMVSGQASIEDIIVPAGEPTLATTFLTYGDDPVSNASCYLDAWDSDGVQLLDAGEMNATGSDGRYTWRIQYNVSGHYTIRTFCNGTALMNRTEYAYATVDITEHAGKLWVGGTEYPSFSETGRIVARLTSALGLPVNNATCNLTIYLPADPVTEYESGIMSIPPNQTNGVYYYDFNQSGEIGVHTYAIDCEKDNLEYFLLGTYNVYEAQEVYMQMIT